MDNKVPKTNREAFAALDAMLTDEDKQAIIDVQDTCELHFGLGLWIRNNWLYKEDSAQLVEAFEKNDFLRDADSVSSKIIEAYRRHLKRIKKKNEK